LSLLQAVPARPVFTAMPLKNSPYRRVRWARPSGLNPPRLINLAIARLTEAFERRAGPVWDAFATNVPVFAKDSRQRRLRSDGAANLLSVLSVLLATSDLHTGFVGSPRRGGGRWDRHSWEKIDHYAFGSRVAGERSMRRLERHARSLKTMQLIDIRELRTVADSEYRSHVAIKRVLPKLWDLLGLRAALRATRRQIERDRTPAAVTELVTQGGAKPPRHQPVNRPAQQDREQRERPPSTAGPTPASDVAQQAIADIMKKLTGR